MTQLAIEKPATALVVIDLQKGVVGMPTEPYSTKTIVANAAQLADTFRKNSMSVFLVRVTPSADGKDGLKPIADNALQWNQPRPADWADIVPELGPAPGDLVITKRQWGAFYGTELEGHPHHRPLRHFDQHRRRKHRSVRLRVRPPADLC